MFPFVLSLGIIAQGIIFAIQQAKGLEGLLILGCEPISQAILPGKHFMSTSPRFKQI